MRVHQFFSRSFLSLSLLAAATIPAHAVEYALSTYALGESAFSAGVTPPPGTYVTAVAAYYSSKIGTAVDFGGVTLNAGAKLDAFSSGLNVLYVPDRKLFGGNLGLSVTIPVGYINIDASISAGSLAASREVNGWGFGDVIPRVQLGWQQGNFAHTVYLEGITTTGFWEKGFAPIISQPRGHRYGLGVYLDGQADQAAGEWHGGLHLQLRERSGKLPERRRVSLGVGGRL